MRKSSEIGVQTTLTLNERISKRGPLNPEEIINVRAMSSFERYVYFVKRVTDTEEIWSLWDKSGLQSFRYDDMKWFIPFWTHKDFMDLALSVSKFSADLHSPRCIPIPIDDWVDEILWEDMRKDGIFAAILPVPKAEFEIVSVESLLEDIRQYGLSFSASGAQNPVHQEDDRPNWWHTLSRSTMDARPKGKLP